MNKSLKIRSVFQEEVSMSIFSMVDFLTINRKSVGSKDCDTRKDERRVTLQGNIVPPGKTKGGGGAGYFFYYFFSSLVFKIKLIKKNTLFQPHQIAESQISSFHF